MNRIDGRSLVLPTTVSTDVVVVGSGPAGATAAAELARHGVDVVVVEAGRWFDPDEYRPSMFEAMSVSYRELGSSVALGRTPTALVQGRMVGGSSPINGAICWRLPRDVWDRWVLDDPALRDALPWDVLEAVTDDLEARLGVADTDPGVQGAKGELMAVGAQALGLAHEPIRRNVVGCRGSGRCLQGCPHGAKRSVDLTLLADALTDGARVLSSVEVQRVVVERGRAIAVVGRTPSGTPVRVEAARGVVLAASAVQTPALLLASGIDQGPVGRHFQAHPGVSMVGRFPHEVRSWEGATQGYQVTGLRHEGLKFETLGYGLDLLAGRTRGFGDELGARLGDLAYLADWGAAVKAEAHGRVRVVRGRPVVTYQPTARDVALFRRGLRVMGEMMLAAGAREVDPKVRGWTSPLRTPADLRRLERDGPRRPSAYLTAITHLFGTTRMGSDPADAVVGPDFAHWAVAGLHVADSSVFPTNTGVNPQISIMALATLCARRVAGVAIDASPLTVPSPNPETR